MLGGFQPVTFGMALAFAAVHLFVGRLKLIGRTPRNRWLSFAGGVAVAYVFMHLMPELAARGAEFSAETHMGEVLAEGLVFALSLSGLVLFYGLEQALRLSRQRRSEDEGRDRPEHGVFWLHIAASAVLIAIIAYLLNHREDPSWEGLVLFFAAMVLHFLTADYGAQADHPELYEARGRWVLAAATLGGWALGLFIALPPLAVGALFAFVGGAIVLMVLKEELPAERESAFVPFLGGAAVYAALVLGETIFIG